MECHFHIEILAPDGLVGLEKPLAASVLGLEIYHSHFNNKNILRGSNDAIELDMQTSTTDVMHASGVVFRDFATAVSLMRELSGIFRMAGYRHKIGVDNEAGDDCVWLSHDYP